MYSVVTTKSFDKRLGGLPVNVQKRILNKILEVAARSLRTEKHTNQTARHGWLQTTSGRLADYLHIGR